MARLFFGFGTICLEHGTIILEFSFKKIVQKWKQIFFETNRVQIKLKKLKKSSKIHWKFIRFRSFPKSF